MKQLAAVIVTHNSAGHLGPCLDAISGQLEAIVVDNASEDGTLEEAAARPWVRLIANSENRGFAAAVNQGARSTAADLILLLNPDAVVERGLDLLATACRKHGIAAGKLVGPDRLVQAGFTIRRLPTLWSLIFEVIGLNRIWPGNPVNRRYRYLDADLAREGPAEQPAGAFLMIRRDVFDSLDGFDESFHPVWFEDVDFAKRARDRGIVPRYFPAAVAVHAGGHSVKGLDRKRRAFFWYASLLRYTAKHFSNMEFRLICGAVAAGSLLRAVAGMVGERTSAAVYSKVFHLAGASLFAGRLRCGSLSSERWSSGGASAQTASHSVRQ